MKKNLFVMAGALVLALSMLSCCSKKGDEAKKVDSPEELFKSEKKKNYNFSQDLVFDGSQAKDITFNADGSVTYVATAAGSGGGIVFYIKPDKSVINIQNYESIEVVLACAPVEGKWQSGAKDPGFGFRVFTDEATGFWSGFEDVTYFDMPSTYGEITQKIEITDEIKAKILENCVGDMIGFTLKFNAYQRGNSDFDELKVRIKSVTFNKIPGTPEDKPYDDGLSDADRGTVLKITYPSQDYAANDGTSYNKPAWVYLPAGYDANDKSTKYPLMILLHGFNQNQDTWGLTNVGKGGKIKGMMDRGMFSGEVEKFILIVPTGVASKNWATGLGDDFMGFNAFGAELRNDIIPYMRANYNVKDGRDNVALAGLSMGGMQTLNIGIGDTLDLISYFGAFSFPVPTAGELNAKMAANGFESYDVNYLYTICGDADFVANWNDYENGCKSLSAGFDKVELGKNFSYERYPGGTHDFPVWYRGFEHFIPFVFKK